LIIALTGTPRPCVVSSGDAPSEALFWAVRALAKARTLSMIGAYSDWSRLFPDRRGCGDKRHRRQALNPIECLDGPARQPLREPAVAAARIAFEGSQPAWPHRTDREAIGRPRVESSDQSSGVETVPAGAARVEHAAMDVLVPLWRG
jgi:hypothetical protein